MAADFIVYCLEKLTDYFQFERLCNDLMALSGYPRIEPLGGTKDKGRDALDSDVSTGTSTVFAYSVREDWLKKLREDASKIRAHGHPCQTFVFLCTSAFTPSERDEAVEQVRTDFGWALDLYGIERLAVLLRTRPEVVRSHPEIFSAVAWPSDRTEVARARIVMRGNEYRDRLRTRIDGFDAPIVGAAAPTERIRAFLRGARRLLIIEGRGGSGKTRLALDGIGDERDCYVLVPGAEPTAEIVSSLPKVRSAVLFVDDAHSLAQFDGIARLLSDPAWQHIKCVMTLRPGFTAGVLGQLSVPPTDTEVVEIDRLPRPAMNELLKNPPHGFGDDGIRRCLIYLAQGNPLIAHMAATALRTTGLHADSAGEFFRRYLQLGKLTPAELALLGLVALLGPFKPEEHEDTIARITPRLDRFEATAVLNGLADRGILDFGSGAFLLKPDSLVPVVIADVFFPKRSSPLIECERVLTPLRGLEARRTIERLAAATQFCADRATPFVLAEIQKTWPTVTSASLREWTAALEFVPAYGGALPRAVVEILDRFLRDWEDVAAGSSDAEQRDVIERASMAAKSLVDEPPDSVRLVLSLSALRYPDLRDTDDWEKMTPASHLVSMFQHGSPTNAHGLGLRARDFVRAVEQWHARSVVRPGVDRRAIDSVGAFAASQLVRLHFEATEESAESANTIHIGVVEAEIDEPLLHAVERATELVCEWVVRAEAGAQLAVLHHVEELSRISRHGMLPVNARPSARAREILGAAARRIVETLCASWDALPIVTRHRLVRFGNLNRDIWRRARVDRELRTMIAIIPARYPGVNYQRWNSVVFARARRLAKKHPGVEGVALAQRMLDAGRRLKDEQGLYPFLVQLVEQAGATDARHVLDAVLGSHRLRSMARFVLGAALRRHPSEFIQLVSALAESDSTAELAASVLESVPLDCERAMVPILLKRTPTAIVNVASHAVRTQQLTVDERFALVLRCCEALEAKDLGPVLQDLSSLIHHKAGGTVSTEHLPRIVTQLERFMTADTSMTSPHVWLEPVLRAVAQAGPEAVMRVVNAYTEHVRHGRARLDAQLARELQNVVASLPDAAKPAIAEALALQLEDLDRPYLLRGDLWKLVRAAAPGERFAALLARWARTPGCWDLTLEGIRGTCPSPDFDVVARALLETAASAQEERQIWSAATPSAFSGPRSVLLRRCAEFFRGWSRDPDERVARVGARAARELETEAVAEEREERAREEGYS